MNRLCTALLVATCATPALADPPILLAQVSCGSLVTYITDPIMIRGDVTIYLDGVFTGARIAADFTPEELARKVIATCMSNPGMSAYWVLGHATRAASE